ncbi:hypothetical protein N9901_02325 [Flavobacteriaceae bacterium]|nr:hypothetical protein [Flavobacteriaceae bacterium]
MKLGNIIQIFLLIFITSSCGQKKTKEEWTRQLNINLENRIWSNNKVNETFVFNNGEFKYFENDTLKKQAKYRSFGEPLTGLMGYGHNYKIYFETKKKPLYVRFLNDTETMIISSGKGTLFSLTIKKIINKQKSQTEFENKLNDEGITKNLTGFEIFKLLE